MAWGIVGGILGVASSLLSGVSALSQAKAQSDSLEANASILRKNAEQKRLETSINEDTVRRQKKLAMSSARAQMAEAGVIEGGTSLGVLAQGLANAEQEALNLRYEGETVAVNYLNNASLLEEEAKQARRAGGNAFLTSLVGAGFSGLAGYTSMGGELPDLFSSSKALPNVTGIKPPKPLGVL